MERNYSEYTCRTVTKRYFEFDKVSDADMAYWLGYMACDGAYVKGDKHSFMSVNSTCYDILASFKNEFAPDSTLRHVGNVDSEKVNAVNDVYELRFSSRQSKCFAPFGIMAYKKDRRIIGIPKSMFLPYLRGAIDADGFITVSHRKDCRTPRLRWFITHAGLLYLQDMQNALNDLYGISTTLRQHGPKVWRLQAQNTEQNIVLLQEAFNIPLVTCNPKKKHVVTSYLQNLRAPGVG